MFSNSYAAFPELFNYNSSYTIRVSLRVSFYGKKEKIYSPKSKIFGCSMMGAMWGMCVLSITL